MKKKICMAFLAMCIAMSATACGSNKETESKDAKIEETKEETTEETKTEEAEGFGNRLVSVDNVDKYVTIGEYKGITLNKTVEAVTDVEVDYRIQESLKAAAEEVEDGEVQMGDVLTIDFVGSKDGVEFEGGKATDYDMVLGEAGFIEGFEEGMVGMKNGESRDLDLKFPEDYHAADLAGADVVFKVTIKSLKRAPELTDEWVEKKTDYKTVEEYRNSIREELQEEAQNNAQMSLQSTAWSTLQANAEIKEYPQEDIDNAIAEFKSETENYAKQGNMTMEEFVEQQNISMEDFEAQCKQYAEYKVAQNLIVQGIMDAEGMEIGDEEWKKEEANIVSMYGAQSVEQITQVYGEAFFNETVGLYRVINFVIANANVQDLVSENGTIGADGGSGEEIEVIEEVEVEAEETEAESEEENAAE